MASPQDPRSLRGRRRLSEVSVNSSPIFRSFETRSGCYATKTNGKAGRRGAAAACRASAAQTPRRRQSTSRCFLQVGGEEYRAVGWTQGDHANIKEGDICTYREQWTTLELSEPRRGHNRTTPSYSGQPIILVFIKGEVIPGLIDGTNRINRWIVEENNDEHDVNIHKVEIFGHSVDVVRSPT